MALKHTFLIPEYQMQLIRTRANTTSFNCSILGKQSLSLCAVEKDSFAQTSITCKGARLPYDL